MAYDDSNVFAKILRGEIPSVKVYEDGETLAFMDIMPQSEGHTLVIPKEGAELIFQLSPDSAASLMRAAQKVAIAVDKALKPDGIAIVQRNGAAAGQTVPHVHFNIVPYYEGKAMAGHAARMVDAKLLEPVAAKIRSAL